MTSALELLEKVAVIFWSWANRAWRRGLAGCSLVMHLSQFVVQRHEKVEQPGRQCIFEIFGVGIGLVLEQ